LEEPGQGGHGRLYSDKSGGVLGFIREQTVNPHHDFRNGAAAARRLLDLNDAGRRAEHRVSLRHDEEGMLLLDLEDLQTMLIYTSEHAAKELTAKYGNVSKSALARSRQLLNLDSQGAAQSFGEPALKSPVSSELDDAGR
jgi:hypothetical protein